MWRAHVRAWLIVALSVVCAGQALAVAQPVIIDLGIAALRGLMMGIGEKAGQEIYERWRGKPSPEGTRPSPPAPSPGQGAATGGGERSPTVPFQAPTRSDGIVWSVSNQHDADLTVQFYSTRKHVWPSGNRAYLVGRGASVVMPLKCEPGEKICFGAWRPHPSGRGYRYWGTGPLMRHNCVGCCRPCGSGNSGVTLR